MRQAISLCTLITLAFATFTPAVASSGSSPIGSALPIPNALSNKNSSSVSLPAGISETSRLMNKDTAQRLSTSPDRVATRSLTDSKLFSKLSPSVVIVMTEDGFGTGSVIGSSSQVLTNWHVVAGSQNVGVVYKPVSEGASPSKADWRRAKVVKIDEVADLALLEIIDAKTNRPPIPVLTEASLAVGEDVNAIGHPTGEAWTYTKGIVSQMRQGYQWKTESGVEHKADVIQTQTPINPGNSGGPLFNEKGYLVGVNSFIADGEGLNFAISASEVTKFLSSTNSRFAQPASSKQKKSTCEIKDLGSERLSDKPATGTYFDLNCDGQGDGMIVTPDDPSKASEVLIDTDGDGKINMIVLDNNNDEQWDESFADTDADGKPDIHGFHEDGSIYPTRVERM